MRSLRLSSFALILSLFTASVIFSQGTNIAREEKAAGTGTGVKPVTVEKIGADISEALAVIEENHVLGNKLNYNNVFKASIDGMLSRLDPHSNYFDAKEFEQFRTDQSSRYYGIGATIGDLSDEKGEMVATYIKATFDNAPAHRGGLRYGDKVVEINGVSMLGKNFVTVRDILRGPRGTPVKLVVERNGTGKRETIEIIRDAVSQPSIQEAYMIRPGIGYIGMTGGFNQTTYREFLEAMTSLKSRGMQQLILDLKGNGGGLVGQAYRVANSFLASGQTVFTQKGRADGIGDTYRAENKNPETMPLVILVNGSSASASEILAGALQDHDRALIVGENSFGKGLVQNPFVLDYGSMLLLTIAKYETPAGRLIQRDYSGGSLYDYYTNGGVSGGDEKEDGPKGPESKTDSGRIVYGGGGITPDVVVKANTIPIERARYQQKLNNPIFAFALRLTSGKVNGHEQYKVERPIVFNYEIKSSDYPITDKLFAEFRGFAVKNYKYSAKEINEEKEFIQRSLRTELVSAAYGSIATFQVINEYDNQVIAAIDLLPQAKDLAQRGQAANSKASAAKSQGN